MATLTATTALALALPLSGAASAAAPGPVPTASKPDGLIESSVAVGATGLIAGAGTVLIVRRHQRRSRGRR
ncbi:hypothetical protein ACFYT4_29430 [Streptomyces sp. NPDC004609]|uniref:hypothetical protein n=1 Tax=Streptomyces sp. NPDC004609 TaxID=3364704 RepID=UPI003683CB41